MSVIPVSTMATVTAITTTTSSFTFTVSATPAFSDIVPISTVHSMPWDEDDLKPTSTELHTSWSTSDPDLPAKITLKADFASAETVPELRSTDMLSKIWSCRSETDPWITVSSTKVHGQNLTEAEKAARRQANHRLLSTPEDDDDCVYDTCMDQAEQYCSIVTTTATTTIFWQTLAPEETPAVLAKLERLDAEPSYPYADWIKWRAAHPADEYVRLWKREEVDSMPMPRQWHFMGFPHNNATQKALKKHHNLVDRAWYRPTVHTWDQEHWNCSYHADSYFVPIEWKQSIKNLPKNRMLQACNDLYSCGHRCEVLAYSAETPEWRKLAMIGGPIVGGILLLVGTTALCLCCKKRVPKSRLPRQPYTHDPEPAMSQAVRSPTQPPRAVTEQRPSPTPAPVPAPVPAPANKTIVRKVEDAAGVPPVVEQTERSVGAPGVVEEVVEPVAPAPTVPVQTVSHAPTGAL